MKIQRTDNSAPLFLKYDNSAVKSNKEQIQYVQKEESPVQVSISEEGKESYRNSLHNLEGFGQYDWVENLSYQKELQEILEKSEIEMVGPHYMEMLHLSETSQDHNNLGGILGAYGIVYEKIMKGYEEGTREIWVADSTQKFGYRKLTQEEDLAALNKAFVPLAEKSVRSVHVDKIVTALREQMDGKKGVKIPKQDEVYEDKLYEMMIAATDEFQKNFHSYENPSEGMSSIIKNLFQKMKYMKYNS